MSLATFWFVVIAFFWLGYLFLEGFDFGVGMLLPILGRDDTERRVLINTIGPVWDGNEVWLIVAVGATFAAFPGWYASLLSGTYLVLALVLLALIGRGVAFEYRGQVDSVWWRRVWDAAIVFGSWVPGCCWPPPCSGCRWARAATGWARCSPRCAGRSCSVRSPSPGTRWRTA